MAISRRVVEADKYVRAGKWKVAWHPSMMLGAPLRGTTLGIIGAGRIGQAMAKRGSGFDMKILYLIKYLLQIHLIHMQEMNHKFGK